MSENHALIAALNSARVQLRKVVAERNALRNVLKDSQIEHKNTVLLAKRDAEIRSLRGVIVHQESEFKKKIESFDAAAAVLAKTNIQVAKDLEVKELRRINALYRKELERMGVHVNPIPVEIGNDA